MIPRRLSQEIDIWIREKKFGNIQINFVGGRITNINLLQSLKVESIGNNVESVSATFSTNVPQDGKLE